MTPMQNMRTAWCQTVLAATVMAAATGAHATCWSEASDASGIPVQVLKAVAKTESGFNVHALNRNAPGLGRDIGLMQINSGWLPTLRQYGIDEADLQDGCTNLKVGAWILANNAKRLGWSWDAIGAYNVGCAKLSAAECNKRRAKYAWKIHAALRKVTPGDIRGASELRRGPEQAASATPRGMGTEAVASTGKIMLIHLAQADLAGSHMGSGVTAAEESTEGRDDDE